VAGARFPPGTEGLVHGRKLSRLGPMFRKKQLGMELRLVGLVECEARSFPYQGSVLDREARVSVKSCILLNIFFPRALAHPRSARFAFSFIFSFSLSFF